MMGEFQTKVLHPFPVGGKNVLKRLFWVHVQLPLWCLNKKMDVLHKVATETPWLCSCRRVTTIHDFYYEFLLENHPPEKVRCYERLENLYFSWVTRLCFKKSDRLISVSNATKQEAFKVVFKSITADNDSEFLDYAALEASVFGLAARTRLYYAHPYSSWERGSNENANRMIRRFIPKGSDISKCTRTAIQEVENWINRYPQKILNFKTAEELFIQEITAWERGRSRNNVI